MEIDQSEDEEEGEDQDSDNAWEDSDDEKVNISLLTSDKLKKLRKHHRIQLYLASHILLD